MRLIGHIRLLYTEGQKEVTLPPLTLLLVPRTRHPAPLLLQLEHSEWLFTAAHYFLRRFRLDRAYEVGFYQLS